MKLNQIATIIKGQDGVVWKNEIFRFDHLGNCNVYNLNELVSGEITNLNPTATFTLDKAELIMPHSNATFWGAHYYAKSDEFPLLYTNVYNSPANFNDNIMGACCVYRLERNGNGFITTLVQIIQIGFTEDCNLWKASPEKHGVRPYGNFVIDREQGFYHAFVMRNEELGTRHFKFKIPPITKGYMDPNYNVKRVILTKEDILEQFDCPFQNYVQGATIYNGKLYSTEGFSDSVIRPAIRVINLNNRKEEKHVDLWEMGYHIEPEFIDFENGVCYYGDSEGNLYTIEF